MNGFMPYLWLLIPIFYLGFGIAGVGVWAVCYLLSMLLIAVDSLNGGDTNKG